MFEWDENKRRSNLEKRGLDFRDAILLFDGRPVFTYPSRRNDEERWGTVGSLEIEGEEELYLVIWTKRYEKIRIISFYRADIWERREYRKLYDE